MPVRKKLISLVFPLVLVFASLHCPLEKGGVLPHHAGCETSGAGAEDDDCQSCVICRIECAALLVKQSVSINPEKFSPAHAGILPGNIFQVSNFKIGPIFAEGISLCWTSFLASIAPIRGSPNFFSH